MRGGGGRIMWSESPDAASDLERLCRTMLVPDAIAEFEGMWGIRLTAAQVKAFKRSRGIRSGLFGGRFEKGHASPNKGRKWDEWMGPEAQERSRATCFKPGDERAAEVNRRPVGTETLREDGYVWVKVADGMVTQRDIGRAEAARVRMGHWIQRSHVNYEAAYGPVPDGCHIFHADGDPTNDDPENLVAVPIGLKGTLTRLGSHYADRETLETAMLMAEVVQATRRAEG